MATKRLSRPHPAVSWPLYYAPASTHHGPLIRTCVVRAVRARVCGESNRTDRQRPCCLLHKYSRVPHTRVGFIVWFWSVGLVGSRRWRRRRFGYGYQLAMAIATIVPRTVPWYVYVLPRRGMMVCCHTFLVIGKGTHVLHHHRDQPRVVVFWEDTHNARQPHHGTRVRTYVLEYTVYTVPWYHWYHNVLEPWYVHVYHWYHNSNGTTKRYL
jgi:hypothetical protein